MKGRRAGITVVLSAAMAAACTASPQPAVDSPSERMPPPIETTGLSVTVAMDGMGPGFNPHLLADQNPVTEAVAGLVLPSMFRPGPASAAEDPPAAGDEDGTAQEDGDIGSPDAGDTPELHLDRAVAESARVVTTNPFTVEYDLANEAQWSDGAPIAVEDFRYLWQQMTSAPGVVDPAGYRLITDVRAAGGGGKTVQVVFSEPYAAWRGLFQGLMPSHLLKDRPGGFESGLADGIPVSGSRFKVTTVDRGRGQILLERNDRFWGAPATPDRIAIRRAGTASQVADSLREGDVQVLDVTAGSAALSRLSVVPGVRVHRTEAARALGLTLNARAQTLANVSVRRALLDLLDPGRLALVGAGSEAGARPVASAIAVPTDPGYHATAPAAMTRDEAIDALRAAGYAVGAQVGDGSGSGDGATAGPKGAGGTGGAGGADHPRGTGTAVPTAGAEETPDRSDSAAEPGSAPGLSVRIGVARGDRVADDVARTIADMWEQSGIEATVSELDADTLYSSALTDGAVDAVVGWSDVSGALPNRVASRFGCGPATVAVGEGGDRARGGAGPKSPVAGTAARPPTTGVPVPTPSDAGGDAQEAAPEAPSNLGGLCDPELETVIAEAMRGDVPDGDLIDAVDPAVWSMATVLPIMQATSIVGFGEGIRGVDIPQDGFSGRIFAGASRWSRTG